MAQCSSKIMPDYWACTSRSNRAKTVFVGRGGALVELTPFIRRVMGSTRALVTM